MHRLRLLLLPLVVVLGLFPGAAPAHRLGILDIAVELRKDDSYTISFPCDFDVQMSEERTRQLASMPEALKEEALATLDEKSDEVIQTLKKEIRVYFDGTAEQGTIELLEYSDTEPSVHANPAPGEKSDARLVNVTKLVQVTGRIPLGAQAFVFSTDTYGPSSLSIHDLRTDRTAKQLVAKGARSEPFRLVDDQQEAREQGPGFMQCVIIGFEHILPQGLDHILFVLGLFLLSEKWKPLLFQITAFTIAHSITLALAMLKIIDLPSAIVESVIALSIVYVAAENIFVREMKWWRPLIVFVFGLLHGMGFAGALSETGLSHKELVSALFAFNIGIELGQLSVVGLAFLAVGWYRHHAWFRPRVMYPVSAAIALVALYWTIERASGIFG